MATKSTLCYAFDTTGQGNQKHKHMGIKPWPNNVLNAKPVESERACLYIAGGHADTGVCRAEGHKP